MSTYDVATHLNYPPIISQNKCPPRNFTLVSVKEVEIRHQRNVLKCGETSALRYIFMSQTVWGGNTFNNPKG